MKLRFLNFKRWFQPKLQEHRCPKRDENWLADQNFPGPDVWNVRGKQKDLTCSFCGSWKAEQFLAFCQYILDHKDDSTIGIEFIPRKLKFYITRPHVQNAEHGAIKFYTCHLIELMSPMGNDEIEVIEQLINAAMKQSNINYAKRIQRLTPVK